ncbi:MAG: MlaD family protein [Alphaproteobacteria bacterium]|nr:MlaD family protein [Alphaproteobacteria bacterium]
MTTDKQKNFWAGAIFVSLLVLVLVQSYRADSFSEDNLLGYPLYARFSDVGGLNNGARVLLAGVDVGRVVGLELHPENLSINVAMDIYSDIGLPLDSSIAIISSGIFGSKYLAIFPGAEFDVLQSGDQFDYTSNSVDVMGIMEDVILSAEKKINERRN